MARQRYQVPVDVELDGTPAPVRVVVDQRDDAAAEAADLGPDCGKLITRTRFLAWNAGRRAGAWSMPWREFNEDLCLIATPWPDDEEVPDGPADDSADPLDPGRKDQTDAG